MTDNALSSNIVHAGGVAVSPGPESALCKAFKEAVDEWCKPDRKKDGTEFNDYFFEKLAGNKPKGAALADRIKREVPILVTSAGGTVTGATTLAAAAKAGGPLSGAEILRKALQDKIPAATVAARKAWKGFRWRALFTSWGISGKGGSLKFPDGMLDGVPIEIKGPRDTYRPGQLEAYSKVSVNGKVIEVSCEKCGATCHDAGNKCP